MHPSRRLVKLFSLKFLYIPRPVSITMWKFAESTLQKLESDEGQYILTLLKEPNLENASRSHLLPRSNSKVSNHFNQAIHLDDMVMSDLWKELSCILTRIESEIG